MSSSFAEMLDFRLIITTIIKGFWTIMSYPVRFLNNLPDWVGYSFVIAMILFGIFIIYHVKKNEEEVWRIRT